MFPHQHSDFLDPFAVIDLLRDTRAAGLRPFDIMLEAKGKDLALLRLREQTSSLRRSLTGATAEPYESLRIVPRLMQRCKNHAMRTRSA